MSNIKWYETKMTSNTVPAPFIASSSGVYAAGYQPYKAFNGTFSDVADCWHSPSVGARAWLQIDFGEKKKVDTFSLKGRPLQNPEVSPRDFTLQGSNDGINFDILHVESGLNWSIGEEKFFSLSSSVTYRYYRLNTTSTLDGNYVLIGRLQFGYTLPIKRLAFKNPTTNQYYSLAEKTLIHLPDTSSKNMILHGIEAGKEIRLDEDFDKIRTIVENEDGTQTIEDESVEPFSVYNYISENPQVVVYTESAEDITVSTTTEPYDLYDEFGDELELLYYTDDETVTEADLVLEANWSPIDELEGDFEIVTWTDEEDSQRVLEMTATPTHQLVHSTSLYDVIGDIKSVNSTDLSTLPSNVRYLFSSDNVEWKRWNGNTFEVVNPTDYKQLGMTIDELSTIDYSKWTNQKINVGVYMEDSGNDSTISTVGKLSINQLISDKTSTLSNINFYILNTTARIDLNLAGLSLTGSLSDADLTRVQYKVSLNGKPYYPLNGEFTSLSEPPQNINITMKSSEIKINDWNTLRVDFRDFFGTDDYYQTTFVGNYSSLMFKDVDGDYYSDDVGEILQYLDFGTVIAGEVTVEHEIILKNQYGYNVKDIEIKPNISYLPEGVFVEFSKTNEPFESQSDLFYEEGLDNEKELSFFVRMNTDVNSTPNDTNHFDVFVKASRKDV